MVQYVTIIILTVALVGAVIYSRYLSSVLDTKTWRHDSSARDPLSSVLAKASWLPNPMLPEIHISDPITVEHGAAYAMRGFGVNLAFLKLCLSSIDSEQAAMAAYDMTLQNASDDTLEQAMKAATFAARFAHDTSDVLLSYIVDNRPNLTRKMSAESRSFSIAAAMAAASKRPAYQPTENSEQPPSLPQHSAPQIVVSDKPPIPS